MLKKIVLFLTVLLLLLMFATVSLGGGISTRSTVETPLVTLVNGWITSSLTFSPDGSKAAYIVRDKMGKQVVLNDKVGRTYEDILDDKLYFSPNGMLMYFAKQGNAYSLIVDGYSEMPYAEIKRGSLIFSPDGQHFAYVAKNRGKSVVLCDNREIGIYDDVNVSTLKFSPDGRRLICAVRSEFDWYVAENGQLRSAPYDGIRALAFNKDGSQLAAIVRKDNLFAVTVNGVPGLGHESIDTSSLKFDATGRKFCYIATNRNKQYVLINHEPSLPYDKIGSDGVVFSENGNSFGYFAKNASTWKLVVNNQEQVIPSGVIEQSLVFSSDGQKYACAIFENNGISIMLNGIKCYHHTSIGIKTMIFSKYNNSLFYIAKDGEKWCVVCDGAMERRYDAIGASGVTLADDAPMYFYSAMRNGFWHIVSDNIESQAFNSILTGYGSGISYSQGVLRYPALKGLNIYLIEEKIIEIVGAVEQPEEKSTSNEVLPVIDSTEKPVDIPEVEEN